MRGRKKDPKLTAATRRKLLETSYELFTKKNIETVSMIEAAKECGFGTTTMYRYYSTKPKLVVAVAAWRWEQFREENRKRRPGTNLDGMTAAEIFEFYLDSFLELYRKHRDLLRFNQFFNVYVRAEHIDAETLQPYRDVIGNLRESFHEMYQKAQKDHTIRTDEQEEEMFSVTLHLMLAAVTRYAVGLVYIPENGFDALKELEKMKKLLLCEYREEKK